jgi:glycosyltransferase involved in cell wall biosynthesis
MNDVRNDHRIVKEMETLIAAGHEVHAVGIVRTGFPRREEFRGIRIRRVRAVPWPTRKTRFVEYAARAVVEALAVRPDVIQANDLDTLLPGWVASRLLRAGLVYDSHELYLETEHLLGRPRELAIWGAIERRIAPKADAVITVAPTIARELEARYGIARVHLVRNLPRYDGGTDVRPLLPDRSPERPVLLHQGYLQKGRGLGPMVEALRFLPEARLVFLGEGSEEAATREAARRAGVAERVIFRAPVALGELLAHTRSADIGLVLYEGRGLNYRYALPNKLFEYIMAGVPVLASDLPEMRAIVAPRGVGRLIDDTTPEGIARAAREMLADRAALAAMSARCREAARELCWESQEKTLVEIYGALAERRG